MTMKLSALALGLSLLPVALLAQTHAGGGSSGHNAPNCKWLAMKGISPDLSIADFLDDSLTGDWLNYDQAGVITIPGKMSIPIPKVPPEIITISERNGRYFARNLAGDAEIEIDAMIPEEQDWLLNTEPFRNPFGPISGIDPVVDLDRIRFETGCDLTDLPLLRGTGQWTAPQGYMDVTLYFLPTSDNDLHVVMIGDLRTAEGAAEVRRGYSMHRLEVEPIGD